MTFCNSARCCFLLAIVLTLVWTTRSFAGEKVEDISFVSNHDGTQQKYLLIFPQRFDKDDVHCALISLHGHGSDRRQAVDHTVNEFRAGLDLSAARNLLVIAPDYRARTSWMGPAAEADLSQIIGELRSRFHVRKIILAGASMGGSSALTFTALHPDMIDGVVSMNGTANLLESGNFQDAIKESFGAAKTDRPLEYKNRSAEYWPERFTMPIAITASGKDTTVPAASVLRFANVIKILHPDNLLLIYRENAGHNTDYQDSKTAYEFVVDKVVSPTSSSPLINRKAQEKR